MQNKTLSERIAEIKRIASLDPYNLPNSPIEVIAAENRLAIKCLNIIEELQAENQNLRQIALDFLIIAKELELRNKALLAKNGELEAKVKELEGKMEWKPISEAPLDGTDVDLWLGDEEFPRRETDCSFREPTDSEFWLNGTLEPEEEWDKQNGLYGPELDGLTVMVVNLSQRISCHFPPYQLKPRRAMTKTETKLYPLFRVIERTKDGDELEHFSSYNWTPAKEKLECLRQEFSTREFYIHSHAR